MIYSYVLVGSNIQKKDSLAFPYLDFGFLYGYGLFETILIRQKQPILLMEHIQRLLYGAQLLDISFEYSSHQCLEMVRALIQKNDVEDGVLNLYLTPGDRSDPLPHFGAPFFLGVIRSLPAMKPTISVGFREESFRRVRLDQIKSMAYMKNILERRLSPDFDDVLLYSQERYILETSHSNVFFVQGNRIVTPKSSVILPGIIRQYLLGHSHQLGFLVEEEEISVLNLNQYDEIFLTNSVQGVIRVSALEKYPHLVSGSITEAIQKNLFQHMSLIQSGI